MAEIVSIIGITHNPFMPRLFKQAQRPPGCDKITERIEMMRGKLAEVSKHMQSAKGTDKAAKILAEIATTGTYRA